MMTNRQIGILFLLGAVLTIVGAMLKIARIPLASLVLIVGMTFEAASGFLLVWKMTRKEPKKDGFLDS